MREIADDLQTQMDSYLDAGVDCMTLYRRWERQQWAVHDLDFSADKSHWSLLDGETRAALRRLLTLFFVGEQAVTDTLSPIVLAAPNRDERLFLATQLADEARHTVFFQRFFAEVLGVHADRALEGEVAGGFRSIFATHLAEDTDRVRRHPEDRTAWVAAVVTYHLVVEGYLALCGQRNLLRFTRATGLMPGFHAGLTAVARDESRHVGFGVLGLRRRVQEEPEMAQRIALRLLELAEATVQTVVDPETKVNVIPPDQLPPELRQSPLEFRAYAQGQLGKRLHALGLSSQVVSELRQTYDSHWETSWSDYERRHGVDHPVRWFQRAARSVC
jgi:ribonucleoside-diphosphate reductase beta chain